MQKRMSKFNQQAHQRGYCRARESHKLWCAGNFNVKLFSSNFCDIFPSLTRFCMKVLLCKDATVSIILFQNKRRVQLNHLYHCKHYTINVTSN